MTLVSPLVAAGKLTERSSPLRLVRGSIATPLTILCALCALLALCAGVARAAAPTLVSNGQFTSEGALGVAVEQSSGDVFVTGFIGIGEEGNFVAAHSGKFTASGEPLSLSAPFAEGGNYGAGVNPSNGNVYVARASGEIDVYDPNTGELLSSFSVPPFGTDFREELENTAQIAVDSAGNVYVPNAPTNQVLEYDPATCVEEQAKGEPPPCKPLKTFTDSGAHAMKGPNGVALDASDDLWVADSGNNRIVELSPTGAPVEINGEPVEIKSEGVKSVALDGHGDVLAIVQNGADPCGLIAPPCAHLVEYSPGGAQLADLGAGELGSHENGKSEFAWDLVAVDTTSGRVYVTDDAKNRVLIFQPPAAPVLGQESAVEVGSSEAKLGALVAPGGVGATYRFEYDTREYKEREGPHGVSVPFPEGSAGEGFSSRMVWASAGGLEPGTTYHYRAVVTNALGTVVGPDQTFTTVTAAEAECPNEQARGGFSAALPDCRAYELVSPVSKDTGEPDTEDGKDYVGHNSPEQPNIGHGVNNLVASDGNRFSYIANEILSAQSSGVEFIASRGASGWSTEDALPLQPYTADRCTWFEGGVMKYASDLSKAIIVVNSNLNEKCHAEAREVVSGEPLGDENLLLRDNSDGGSYRLINLTPPGVAPETPSLLGASGDLNVVVFSERASLTPEAPSDTENLYEWNEGVLRLLRFESPSGAPLAGTLVRISNDGSDEFFTAGGNLYVRLNGGERTVQLDETRGGSGPGGGGALAAVTADGSQVFFTDNATAGLTSDTVAGSGTNLYRYDLSTGQLSDLTPVSDAEAGLVGISEDGSYVYFSSKGVLSGSEANQFGETAQNGQENLYLQHGGTLTFLRHAGAGSTVSANGAFLLTLNGYLYSVAANRFVSTGVDFGGPNFVGVHTASEHAPFLSNSGQVFFQEGGVLLPRDTDGQTNVYEFDYESGLHLISSGTSSTESVLLGASPSGNDVFFLTRQSLVAQDSAQEANKIYDARVDGGFPEPVVASCTTADACRAAPEPQPSLFGAPSSETFSGAGNISEAPSTPAVKVKALTRSQKLAKALAACRKDRSKHKRQACEKKAHKAYAAARSATAKRSNDDRRASR